MPEDTESAEKAKSAEKIAKLREEILSAQSSVVVSNHAYGLFELASIYLGADPPRLADATLAIDALAGLLSATEDRLAESAGPLREGLKQLQMAYIEMNKLE